MTSHTFEGETVTFPDYKGQDYLWVQKKLPGNRAPDFTGTQPRKVYKCLNEGRCGACGLLIPGESVYFVTAASALKGKTDTFDCTLPMRGNPDADGPMIHLTEPPLHRVCARLATMLCPVLRDQRDGPPCIIEVRKHAYILYTQSVGWVRAGHYPRRVLSTWVAKPLPKKEAA